MFDYCFAYEDRDYIKTSRWALSGVRTKSGAANIYKGRLWMTCSKTGDVVTADLYKGPTCAVADKVLTGTCNVASVSTTPVKCTLAASGSSGLSGEFYFESYTADPAAAVEVLVSLVMDENLLLEYARIADLPAYDSTAGLADYCAEATKEVLLLVSQIYADEIGGHGAPEGRFRTDAVRDYPDYRRIANPDQLQRAAKHWALMLALGRSHDMADNTAYSALAEHHDNKRQEAISGWNIAFNTTPDEDDDADNRKGSMVRRVTRV